MSTAHPAPDDGRPALFSPARIVVDSWPPEYTPAFQPDEDLEPPDVDLSAEVDESRWAPLVPGADVPAARDVVFVDGVQRADARVTLVPDSDDDALVGVCGSFGAGSVRSRDGQASFGETLVERGLFARAHSVTLDCGPGIRYRPYPVTDPRPDRLYTAMTERMRALERRLAIQAADAELVVVDGPLSGGRVAEGLVGLIKTHRRHFLPESHRGVVAALDTGQRTPVFSTRSNYTSFSWYLRLPGPRTHPWAGVVRIEVPADVPLERAVETADQTAVTLRRFASEPHRDPRAPQNLVPIGALEHRLRHLLGDPALLERLLRRTCATWGSR